MAKLGYDVQWQVTKTIDIPAETAHSIQSQQRDYALKSDGKLLRRDIVVFRPNAFSSEPRRENMGWKLVKRVDPIEALTIKVALTSKGYSHV